MPIRKAQNLIEYQTNYKFSIENPQVFWAEEAKRLAWFTPFTKVMNPQIADQRWFEDGELNVSYNCLDRHLPAKAEKAAIIWQNDDLSESKTISYAQLHEQVCKFANVLKDQGIKKSDTVVIYMPMIPEAAVAMLACARIGAIHSVVFAGFSAQSLKNRIIDCKAKLVITVDEGRRGGRVIKLKQNVEEAAVGLKVIVVNCYNQESSNDLDYYSLMNKASDNCLPEKMNAEDPLFILYTSGSTGKPKGVVHSSAGYLLYASMTHEHVFDLEESDVYWSTADIGWITGHSYVIYGPLCNGTTTLMFEGTPTYPNVNSYWKIIEQHKVSIFYTAPTALRSLIRYGDEMVLKADLSSLRILGSVGEPIDPKTWQWFHDVVGGGKCHIVDTWWQTETGGIMIAPLARVDKQKPGSAALPFYAIMPEILEKQALVIKKPWPGSLRGLYLDKPRFLESYFNDFPEAYYSGDGAYQDLDGYYWIIGRMDDVLKVSGHRIGSAEIEAVLEKVDVVAESAIVGFPHDIKGEGIYAYVVIKNGFKPSLEIEKELIEIVRKSIGAIATIDKIQWVDQLPKTRSGKIMRRILRKIAVGELDNFGDISTLLDPEVIKDLIQKS